MKRFYSWVLALVFLCFSVSGQAATSPTDQHIQQFLDRSGLTLNIEAFEENARRVAVVNFSRRFRAQAVRAGVSAYEVQGIVEMTKDDVADAISHAARKMKVWVAKKIRTDLSDEELADYLEHPTPEVERKVNRFLTDLSQSFSSRAQAELNRTVQDMVEQANQRANL